MSADNYTVHVTTAPASYTLNVSPVEAYSVTWREARDGTNGIDGTNGTNGTDGTNFYLTNTGDSLTISTDSGATYVDLVAFQDIVNASTISKEKVGLGNADDTSDVNKPISTATQTALNLKANLAGSAFTGDISSTGTNNTLANQEVSSAGSIVTKAIGDKIYRRLAAGKRIEIWPANSGMTGTYTGGAGGAFTSAGSWSLNTNAAASATVVFANGSNVGYQFARPGYDWNEGLRWTRPFVMSFRTGTTAPTANSIAYYKLGEAYNNLTFGPLTKRGIGIKADGLTYKSMVHDGTNLRIGTVALATAATGYFADFDIVSYGNGTVDFFVNGTLRETVTSGPASTGLGSAESSFQIHLTNGATAAITYAGIYGPLIIQFLD